MITGTLGGRIPVPLHPLLDTLDSDLRIFSRRVSLVRHEISIHL